MLGDCLKANSQEVFKREPGEDLQCPSCDNTLEPITDYTPPLSPPKWLNFVKRASIVTVPLLGIVAILAISGVHIPVFSRTPSDNSTIPNNGGASSPAETAAQTSNPAQQTVVEAASPRPPKQLPAATMPADAATVRTMVRLAVENMQGGKLDEARVQLRTLLAQNPGEPLAHYNMAIIALRQSKPDEALKEFEQSFVNGFDRFDLIDKDPDLDKFRSDPSFIVLLDRYRRKD